MNKNSKQLRFDFPDYTAENQERDAQRYEEKLKKDVYIVKVRGEYGAYIPQESLPLSLNSEGRPFKDFILCIKEFCEERLEFKPRFRCIMNKGVEDYLISQIETQRLIDNHPR